jgi:hypothetical protein
VDRPGLGFFHRVILRAQAAQRPYSLLPQGQLSS